MSSSDAAVVTLPADDQILITREFDAPKHLAHEAWATPELVKRWWSGQRGEVTIAEIDYGSEHDHLQRSGRTHLPEDPR